MFITALTAESTLAMTAEAPKCWRCERPIRSHDLDDYYPKSGLAGCESMVFHRRLGCRERFYEEQEDLRYEMSKAEVIDEYMRAQAGTEPDKN